MTRAAAVLAPNFGAPPSLHQAAQEIGVEVKALEKALKVGIRLGDFVAIGKNRYVPKSLMTRLKIVAELLACRSNDGFFTSVEYRNEVDMGRNFVIAILEYFDQLSFTARVGNSRRLVCSGASILLTESGK